MAMSEEGRVVFKPTTEERPHRNLCLIRMRIFADGRRNLKSSQSASENILGGH